MNKSNKKPLPQSAYPGLGLMFGTSIGTGLGIVFAVSRQEDVATGLMWGASLGTSLGLFFGILAAYFKGEKK